jgi:hypothetical protein
MCDQHIGQILNDFRAWLRIAHFPFGHPQHCYLTQGISLEHSPFRDTFIGDVQESQVQHGSLVAGALRVFRNLRVSPAA